MVWSSCGTCDWVQIIIQMDQVNYASSEREVGRDDVDKDDKVDRGDRGDRLTLLYTLGCTAFWASLGGTGQKWAGLGWFFLP